jgi:hypothetical protein
VFALSIANPGVTTQIFLTSDVEYAKAQRILSKNKDEFRIPLREIADMETGDIRF